MTTDLGVAAKISSSGEQLVRNPDLIPIQARGEFAVFVSFFETMSARSFRRYSFTYFIKGPYSSRIYLLQLMQANIIEGTDIVLTEKRTSVVWTPLLAAARATLTPEAFLIHSLWSYTLVPTL